MSLCRQVLQYVTELLNRNVGFLINERFINIPAQVGTWKKWWKIMIWLLLLLVGTPADCLLTYVLPNHQQITVNNIDVNRSPCPFGRPLWPRWEKPEIGTFPLNLVNRQRSVHGNIELIYLFPGHYIMICKLYKSKTEAPNSQPQQVN